MESLYLHFQLPEGLCQRKIKFQERGKRYQTQQGQPQSLQKRQDGILSVIYTCTTVTSFKKGQYFAVFDHYFLTLSMLRPQHRICVEN